MRDPSVGNLTQNQVTILEAFRADPGGRRRIEPDIGPNPYWRITKWREGEQPKEGKTLDFLSKRGEGKDLTFALTNKGKAFLAKNPDLSIYLASNTSSRD